MGEIPRLLATEQLPKFMKVLTGCKVPDPQILFMAVGDAYTDRAPLQVGQFESGIEIEDDLGRLFLEGGGGADITESYELALYFMSRHTSLDCWEKRATRGYLFVIGDEIPYPQVKRPEVRDWTGDALQADIPVPELIAELQQTYAVYHVLTKMTSNWGNATVSRRWARLLGQNVLRLEDPAGICELIASTIGVAEGKVDLDHLAGDLQKAGSSGSVARAVRKALHQVGG
jgi:hypothetical protein